MTADTLSRVFSALADPTRRSIVARLAEGDATVNQLAEPYQMTLPIIRMTRDFAATPEQLFRAHTDPVLFAQWVGPDAMDTRIEHWDARTGGSWRFVSVREGEEYAFRGCFHEVRRDRIVQTFTF